MADLCRLNNVRFDLKIHFEHVDPTIFKEPYTLPSLERPPYENYHNMDRVPQVSKLESYEKSNDPVFRTKALRLWNTEKVAKQILSYNGRFGELEEFRTDEQRQRFQESLWPQDPVEPNQYLEFNHVGPPVPGKVTEETIGDSIS